MDNELTATSAPTARAEMLARIEVLERKAERDEKDADIARCEAADLVASADTKRTLAREYRTLLGSGAVAYQTRKKR